MKIKKLMVLIILIFTFNSIDSFGQNQPIDYDFFINQLNEIRLSGCKCGDEYFPPVKPVRYNATLQSISQQHSQFMAMAKTLSHYGENGTDPGIRMRNAGYNWRIYAENVGMGYTNTELALEGWMKSAPHCANIMNDQIEEIGLGRFQNYWTLKMGTQLED